MSEDAPVNTGVVVWPDPYSAGVAVRRMQTKLHLWAARDPGRRFDGWRFAHNGVVFTGASSVSVSRYRYRGGNIPTPWTPKPPAAASG
jgi:RNA-directed DNA polymerase